MSREHHARKIDWDGGVLINGERLTHLRFADDIVLVAESIEQLQTMLNTLDRRGLAVGLKINRTKTKYMRSDGVAAGRITVGSDELEEVQDYVYLGQEVNMRRDMEKEISRRIRAGWKAFNSVKDVLKARLDKSTRAGLFNATVLPAMLYACETWATTKREEQRLTTAQRAMERAMLGLSLRDHIRNEEVRERTGVKDVIAEYKESKFRWAGHVARFTDGRWTRAVVEWYPRDRKRPLGRAPLRWDDEIRKRMGPTWTRTARSREDWKRCCGQRGRLDSH